MPSDSRERLQRALSAVAVALAVAALAYAISCLFCWPAPANKGFGEQWALMSENPLALKGQFPQRILAPQLAWSIGMGGERYVYFVRALHVVMLACAFLWARRLGTRPLDAALVTLAIALTAPVQMYKLHWVGYCDPLSYALFFVAAMCVARPAVFWPLFFANLLTHELAVFLLPWLWFLRRQQDANWRVDAAWLTGIAVVYADFYFAVKAGAADQVYSYTYFLEEDPLFPWGSLAIWLMTLTHWLLAFGPVLAVVAWHWHSRSYGRERWQLWIVAAGIFAILALAFDWMRHANLIVLPFVLASARFLQAGHRLAYGALLAATTLFLWLHPPWDAGGEPTRTLWNKLMELVVLVQPKDLSRVVTDWLPAVWPTLLWVYALLACVWLVGFVLAKKLRP